jgi:Ca2+-binding EF-hand superfamily protein
MRFVISPAATAAFLLSLTGALHAQTPPALVGPPAPPVPAPPAQELLVGGQEFITPAGEPIISPDKLSGAEHWFAATDTNHDGKLSLAEFMADSDRFFARLDTDHDGEIGPSEIDHYETDIAPETRVESTGSDYVPSGGDDDSTPKAAPYPGRLGAGAFGYIDVPEPLLPMDTNFNRGISRAEFDAAMRDRFALLDTNHNGFITRDELPKLGQPRGPARGHGGGRGHGRGGHGGHRGGFGGGGGFGGSGDFGDGPHDL